MAEVDADMTLVWDVALPGNATSEELYAWLCRQVGGRVPGAFCLVLRDDQLTIHSYQLPMRPVWGNRNTIERAEPVTLTIATEPPPAVLALAIVLL